MTKFIKSSRRPGVAEAGRIRQAFTHYDEDHDGGISKDEFMKMLSALGIKLSEEDSIALFMEVDLDKSGKIETGEFLDHYYTLLSLAELEEAKVMQELTSTTTFTRSEIEAMHANFKRISKMQCDDGIIDNKEFKSMMLNGNVASWDSFLLDGLFRMFDIDKSGGITFEEFVKNLSIYHNKIETGGDEKDRLMFNIYDVDGDGLISEADISCVLVDCFNSNHLFIDKKHVDDLVRATFGSIEGGKAGKLNFDHFKAALHSNPLEK